MKRLNLILIAILLLAAFLRLYRLGEFPSGLFGDEVDVGYNAYSILLTGKDYNGNPWPIHFESFGDYRPPLYLYLTAPAIAIFGLTPFAVRFPAALFGVLGIFFSFLLTEKLFGRRPALLISLLLAILPWHIHYSRAAFEVSLMFLLLVAGVYYFLAGLNRHRFFYLAAALFALAPYAYNVAKLFSPLLLVGVILIYRRKLLALPKKVLILGSLVLMLVAAPMIYDSIFGFGQGRFAGINITRTEDVVPLINLQRGQDQIYAFPGSRFFHNKPLAWGKLFLENYLTSLSPQFLFFSQIDVTRHSAPGSGLIYLWLTPFLLAGLYWGASKRAGLEFQLAFFWLLAAPVASSLTIGGGNHPTRLFVLVFPLVLFSALGLSQALNWVKEKGLVASRLSVLILSLLAAASLGFYLDQYYIHYPLDSYRWWNFGFREAVQLAKSKEGEFEQVIFSKSYAPPLVYFLFHYQFDPHEFHQELDRLRTAEIQSPTPERLGKYWFATIAKGDKTRPPDTLYLAAPWDETEGWQEVGTIKTPDGTEVFKVLYSGKGQ